MDIRKRAGYLGVALFLFLTVAFVAVTIDNASAEWRSCSKCGGNGQQYCGRCNGNGQERCGFCQGSGQMVVGYGDDQRVESCQRCNGTGYYACTSCGGGGIETCSLCNGAGGREWSN